MAANYRGIPNRVQIGINDTPLTSALERGDFKSAEKLIEENMDPSYLDEGPFEKIPLALMLSSEAEMREYPRHLRLAKLIVEGGANPNLRIPQYEWQGASPSPMEYLMDLYDLVNELCRDGNSGPVYEECLIDPLFTIGLHDETKLTAYELREQLLELLDVFLACGGNPNVTTTTANSTLYHVVVAHPDPNLELVMKMCEAGGDLNQTNVHGTTPLMDLVTCADGDLALEILYNIWKKKPDISSLQTQNCSNETALWRSMLAGSPKVATELLRHGASPIPRAMITIGKWHSANKSSSLPFTPQEVAINGVSAILAPLLQDSSPYVRHTVSYTRSKFDVQEAPHTFHVDLLDKVFSCAVSPIVDNTSVTECFPREVFKELERIASAETKFAFDTFLSLAMKPQDVATLIFGRLSAGLQQMCVRQIVHHVFFTQEPKKSMELIQQLKIKEEKKGSDILDGKEEKKGGGVPETDCTDYTAVESPDNITQWDVVMELNKTTIQTLVTDLLNLPPSLTSRFEIESTRLQLGASLYTFESIDCIQGCDGQSDEGSSDPFVDIDIDDDDDNDDDNDDDESDWFSGFMSSDEYDGMNSNTEWETEEDGTSDDDNKDENDADDAENYDHDYNNADECDNFDDNDDSKDEEDEDRYSFCVDETSNSNDVVMDVAEEEHDIPFFDYVDGNIASDNNSDKLERDLAGSENTSSDSGDLVPGNIRRDVYKLFGNDPQCDDTMSSSEDTSHSAESMDTSTTKQ